MSILSDQDIIDYIALGKLSIEPFEERCLTPNGYDLRIGEILVEGGEKITEGTVRIPPGKWFAVGTLEYVKLGAELTAQLWLRTTWARRGVLSSFGKVDAGFQGALTLSAVNASSKEVSMSIGERFAQIVLETLLTVPKALYTERSGNYQGRKGIYLGREP